MKLNVSRVATVGASTMAASMLGLSMLGFAGSAAANTSNGYNLPMGVTEMSHEIYDLHMLVFWICVGIAVVVFGAMIYSLLKFRRSQGAVADTSMVHSTKVEVVWTVIPVLILVVMAVPAAETILKIEDTRNPSSRYASRATSGSGSTNT
jgi:cytochrome c oxidase subunit 2